MKILYILTSYNLYGGTPKKTLDLIETLGGKACLYVYENKRNEFKYRFINTGATIYEGFYRRNLYRHLRALLKIVDEEKIDIVQTQFSMGETLGYLIKMFRPKIKLIIAIVGTNKPTFPKNILIPLFYRKVDHVIFVSKYAQYAKIKQFPILKSKSNSIIYNGTKIRENNGEIIPILNKTSILGIGYLAEWKNLNVLIETMNILINRNNYTKVYLYLAGDGPLKEKLNADIRNYTLDQNVFLLGCQSNIGALLQSCDIFVHPCNIEAFGIAVTEAMMAKKPIIVSDAGALPELIQNNYSGLIVSHKDPNAWAGAILHLINNPDFAATLAQNAQKKALEDFTVENFTNNYLRLYKNIVD